MMDDELLVEKYRQIHDDTQVIVSHGPPLGHGDLVLRGEHVGSRALLDRMRQLPALKLVVTGHIHEARGSYETAEGVTVVNASIMSARYQPIYPPVVVDWPPS